MTYYEAVHSILQKIRTHFTDQNDVCHAVSFKIICGAHMISVQDVWHGLYSVHELLNSICRSQLSLSTKAAIVFLLFDSKMWWTGHTLFLYTNFTTNFLQITNKHVLPQHGWQQLLQFPCYVFRLTLPNKYIHVTYPVRDRCCAGCIIWKEKNTRFQNF